MAYDKAYGGVTDDQVIKASDRVRDIRPTFRKMSDGLQKPANMVITLMMHAAVAYLYPGAAAWVLISATLLFLSAIRRHEVTPLKVPIQAGKTGVLDANEKNPSNGAPMPGQGIFFIGNDIRNAKEVWLTNSDCRQHFLVLGTTGAGKSLGNSTLIHTPLGWRRMGDIKLGGRVSTPDGRSAEVIGVYPQGELDICRVTFADGRTLEACPEHLWEIHHKHGSGRHAHAGMAQPRLLRTREIGPLLASNKGTFSVRLSDAVEKPAAAQALDAYSLGAMLGDGSFTQQTLRFTSADREILEAVGAALPPGLELHRSGCNAAADWNIRFKEGDHADRNPLLSSLKDLGLFGLVSENKFIPQAYKDGSVAQRWALVQGLMDTDGSCDACESALSYSTSSFQLAKDFQEVIWSLGGIADISPPRQTWHVHDGVKLPRQLSYQVAIRHPEPSMFFTVPRKCVLAERPYQHADNLKLDITGVEMNVRRELATCILIDHPDHLFVAENYVVTHNTETLLGFAANALSWGSGFLFCDGKGDVSLFAKVYAMARRFGREDDLLVLNFMNGNSNGGDKNGRIRSNTMNPFAVGSSDGLVQMIVSLMDDVGGDGAMWKGRATAMLTGIMYALCWLRDQGMLELNVGEIRDHMNLKKIIELSDEKLHPDLPPKIRHSIRSYLTSLPGYQEDKKEKQAQTTLDQHGYLEMQFTRIFGNLADVYGHIFATPYGEVDMYDVVLNRRLLVIMLPALEKSGDEIANLGKVVVAALKGMMGATLGNKLEGDWETIVDNRPTNSPSPFMVILDEVGYYTVEGMALMAAQARSLGFSMVYASQDLNAMKRLNEKEAQSIIANTNTKLFMRTEDPDTGQLAIDLADEALRVQVNGPDREHSELGSPRYIESTSTNVERAKRITLTDLKSQGEGEMHVLFQDKVVRARGFYAAPQSSVDKRKLRLRANHFVWVPKPSIQELESVKRAPELMARMADPEFPAILGAEIKERLARLNDAADEGDEIAMTARTLQKMVDARRKPIEAACAAVADVMRSMKGAVSAFNDGVRDAYRTPAVTVPSAGGFGPVDLDMVNPNMGDDEHGGFSDPFGVQPGVPFTDVPPPSAPQRRPFAPPRRAPKVDQTVQHGATIDEGEIVNMADRIASNDAIMKSLAALDFDSDDVNSTPEAVESRIEEALGGFVDGPQEPPVERVRMVSAVEAFDRAAAALHGEVTPAAAEDMDTEGGEGGEEGGELVSAFLEQLLSDED